LVKFLDLEQNALPQLVKVFIAAGTEADLDHRMFFRPVPVRFGPVQIQAGKQFPPAGESLFHGVHQEALAEAPGP